MKKQTLLLMAALLTGVISYAQKSVVHIHSSKEVMPVMIGKSLNPVLKLKITNPYPEKNINLESISLSLKGTSNISDIDSVRIFFQPEGKNQPVQYGKTLKAARLLTFSESRELVPGQGNFLVSVSLAPSAGLSDKVNVSCQNVKVSKEKTITEPSALSPCRIGYVVRKHNDDGCDTYRIPGLVKTPKGTLLAVYDARWNNAADLQEDIDVGLSRSLDNGQTWLPMQKAIDMGEWGGKSNQENGIGDPAILVDQQTGRIWVSALWLHGNKDKRAWWASKPGMTPEETGQFVLAYSDDEGATWSEPINITGQVKNPEWYLCFNGPGMGITKKDGTLVFAAQFKDSKQIPHSTIIYSKDQGKTWHIGTGAKDKTTEAQVVELADGSLMLNMRDDRGGSRSVAVTRDFGQTWEEHSTSRKALPEPVCQASIIRITLKDGREALAFFNPATSKGRSHLTLKLSFDEGLTWPEKYHTLIYEPGSYGYSCLTQLDPSTLGVLYEGAGDLYFQRINLDEIIR